MSMEIEYSTIGDFGEVVMGMSPKGDTYNEEEEGLPLLNGPTEFGSSHPIPSLFTTDSKRESNIGDLIFCVRGSTTGRMNWANQIYSLGRGVCAIRGKTDNDTKYIKYVLDVKLNSLLKFAGGGTFPNLKKDDIKDFKIPILKEKDKLVSIISAYDNLIENNLKRIKLLEQAAQNIYKEWFVNLRFPGHENKSINEDTGLPDGWCKMNLYDFAEIQMGYAFKAKDFNDEMAGNPAIRIRDILDGWTKTYTTETVNEKYYVEHGDILIGMDGIFHMGIWSGQEKALLVQRVCRLRANNKNLQGYLLESLRAPIKYYEQTISGATVAHLGAKHLKEIFILIPDEKLLNKLSLFNTFDSQIITLNKQNQKLKAARDILLPRLMNRTIEV
tara:strand:- start:3194 stop:4351 length:1158 start_codon:yes stop_codon:yes gene_type:complete